MKAAILAKGFPDGNSLPADHFGQFTHALGNIRFLNLGGFLEAKIFAAVAGGDYTPDANATNGVLIADVGFAIWNFDTSTFDAVNFPQLTAEGVLTQKINDIFDGLVVTVGQTADGLITEKGLRVAGDAALSGRVTTLEADPTTQTALDSETTQRQAADTNLSTLLTTEATTREGADDALQTAINNEATTRASADVALDGRLSCRLVISVSFGSLLGASSSSSSL